MKLLFQVTTRTGSVYTLSALPWDNTCGSKLCEVCSLGRVQLTRHNTKVAMVTSYEGIDTGEHTSDNEVVVWDVAKFNPPTEGVTWLISGYTAVGTTLNVTTTTVETVDMYPDALDYV